MAQVKLLSMTAVVTVLIWASADSLVNQTVSITVFLEPIPPATATEMIVTAAGSKRPFEVQVSGPRRIVDDVRAQGPLPIRVAIPDRPTGPAEIPLDRASLKREMAEQFAEFRKLAVVSIQPDVLPILVDHWVTKEVAITAKRLGMAYDVEPQFQPTATTVRMRDIRLQSLSTGQAASIDISAELQRLLKGQPPGQSVTIPVTLDARAFGPDAVLNPNVVEVTATLQAQRATAEIATVPILVAISFSNFGKPYEAVARDGTPLSLVTRTIRVTGLAEDVGRLVRGATRVYGIIHLKEADLEQLDSLKLVVPEYHLPKGVDLAEPAAPIEFKLIPARGDER